MSEVMSNNASVAEWQLRQSVELLSERATEVRVLPDAPIFKEIDMGWRIVVILNDNLNTKEAGDFKNSICPDNRIDEVHIIGCDDRCPYNYDCKNCYTE